MDPNRKGTTTRCPRKVSVFGKHVSPTMSISPNKGNMERSGEKYVLDFESLLMVCLWQKHQK